MTRRRGQRRLPVAWRAGLIFVVLTVGVATAWGWASATQHHLVLVLLLVFCTFVVVADVLFAVHRRRNAPRHMFVPSEENWGA